MGRYGEIWGDTTAEERGRRQRSACRARGRRHEIWGDLGRDGERWGGIPLLGRGAGCSSRRERCRRGAWPTSAGRTRGRRLHDADLGRYGEIWGDIHEGGAYTRSGEIWGDLGIYGEIYTREAPTRRQARRVCRSVAARPGSARGGGAQGAQPPALSGGGGGGEQAECEERRGCAAGGERGVQPEAAHEAPHGERREDDLAGGWRRRVCE